MESSHRHSFRPYGIFKLIRWFLNIIFFFGLFCILSFCHFILMCIELRLPRFLNVSIFGGRLVGVLVQHHWELWESLVGTFFKANRWLKISIFNLAVLWPDWLIIITFGCVFFLLFNYFVCLANPSLKFFVSFGLEFLDTWVGTWDGSAPVWVRLVDGLERKACLQYVRKFGVDTLLADPVFLVR